jgi:hypothetical protein
MFIAPVDITTSPRWFSISKKVRTILQGSVHCNSSIPGAPRLNHDHPPVGQKGVETEILEEVR